jgi:tetrahydromethanopterin S-methyltransferase subunit E
MVSINGRMVVHMLLIHSVSVACLVSLCYFKQTTLQMNFPLLTAHTFGIHVKPS